MREQLLKKLQTNSLLTWEELRAAKEALLDQRKLTTKEKRVVKVWAKTLGKY